MSTRCRNDLVGCKSRVQSELTHWREAVADVEEVWNDATAQAFQRDHFSEAQGTLMRMIQALQEASDLVHSLERRLADD